MLISIIVPCYNLEFFVERTINSVLQQTYGFFELLLIDDGSNDGTLQILKQYERVDKRIKVIKKINGGVSSARNMGIIKSSGKYILFLDGDDIIEKDLLAIAVKEIKSSNIDIFSYGFNIIGEDNIILKEYSYNKYHSSIMNGEEFLNLFFEKKIRQHICSFIVRKEIILENNITFSEAIVYGEDQEFQIKLLLVSGKVYYNKKCFFHYMVRDSSAMNSILNIKYIDVLKALDKIENYILNYATEKRTVTNFNNYISMLYIYLFKIGIQRKGNKVYFLTLEKYVKFLKKSTLVWSQYGLINFVLARLYMLVPKSLKFYIINHMENK